MLTAQWKEDRPYEEYIIVDQEVDDDFICCICTGVCRDVVTSPCCTKLLCKGCVSQWFSQPGRASCPCCSSSSTSSLSIFIPNGYAQRKIRSLPIRCPLGCDKAAGLVIGVDERTVNEHLTNQCPFRQVACTDGWGQRIQQCDLNQHQRESCPLRTIQCAKCSSRCQSADEKDHLVFCRKNTVPCPLACHTEENLWYRHTDESLGFDPAVSHPTTLQRWQVPGHLYNDCSHAKGLCRGCGQEMQRYQSAAHCETTEHKLAVAQNEINQLRTALVEVVTGVAEGRGSELKAVLRALRRSRWKESTGFVSLRRDG